MPLAFRSGGSLKAMGVTVTCLIFKAEAFENKRRGQTAIKGSLSSRFDNAHRTLRASAWASDNKSAHLRAYRKPGRNSLEGKLLRLFYAAGIGLQPHEAHAAAHPAAHPAAHMASTDVPATLCPHWYAQQKRDRRDGDQATHIALL